MSTVSVAVRINKYIDVDVDLAEITDEEMTKEMERRRKPLPPTALSQWDIDQAYLSLRDDSPPSIRRVVLELSGRIA